jgi:general secretion pathway protein L
MSKLIVSLPYPAVADNGNTAYHYVMSNDGKNRGKSGVATLNELPKADATILVVPAKALSWQQVDLPKVPKARLRAALDGLLEERLLDDTSALSFALSPEVLAAKSGTAATGVWVAACDKAWLSAALKALDAANCRVTQVVPEFWPQSNPAGEPVLCVTGTPEEAWITRADGLGVMTLPFYGADTSGVLDALLADLPAATPILAEPAVVSLAESSFTHKVQLRQHTDGLLQSATSPWELAQFEQSLSGDSQGVKNLMKRWQNFWQLPAWRPARWGLVAIAIANVVGLNVWAWQQKTSLSAKRTQMNALLTQAFPSVKVVVDAPQQMAREMAVLRQSAGAGSLQNFESMLSAFSTSNTTIAGVNITPNAIDYIANSTNLKGVKLLGDDLKTAQNKLKTMGYSLTQSGDTVTLKEQVTP